MKRFLALLLVIIFCFFGCDLNKEQDTSDGFNQFVPRVPEINLDQIPAFSGTPYFVLNNNVPFFTEHDIKSTSFEYYSPLDDLGRCGVCIASIGKDLMPTEERGNIGSVKPTGWQISKYDFIDGKYLYNRCHLIGFQLTGENANTSNLITGTRYLNVQGMLPFENLVADYIKETENHVMYRVTPIFRDDNLIAEGVVMEGYSVEDQGDGVCFNVFCYNVQPKVEIDYRTGNNKLAPENNDNLGTVTYILNYNSKKFHLPTCPSVDSISDKNRGEAKMNREELIVWGYTPCGSCNP